MHDGESLEMSLCSSGRFEITDHHEWNNISRSFNEKISQLQAFVYIVIGKCSWLRKERLVEVNVEIF